MKRKEKMRLVDRKGMKKMNETEHVRKRRRMRR